MDALISYSVPAWACAELVQFSAFLFELCGFSFYRLQNMSGRRAFLGMHAIDVHVLGAHALLDMRTFRHVCA